MRSMVKLFLFRADVVANLLFENGQRDGSILENLIVELADIEFLAELFGGIFSQLFDF
jgi:hypothetical protein